MLAHSSVAGRLERVVIVGNGPAGNAAASVIRKHDPGVRVSILSEEPFPFYSPCFLHEYLSGELDRESLFVKRTEDYGLQGIEAHLGRAVLEIDFEGKRVFHASGKTSYSRLILATGGRPIRPRLPGAGLAGVFSLKTLADGDAIAGYCAAYNARSACVVGAGPIGIEAADSLRSRGMDVLLVERESSILARLFSGKMAAKVQQILESRKLKVLTGTELVGISGEDRVQAVQLGNGVHFDCDLVILSIGMRPNIEIAARAGMNTGVRGGIPVDAGMRTSIPDVYACGDCAEIVDPFLGAARIAALWPNAVLGGKTAGLNCLGIARSLPPPVDFTRINIPGMDAVSLGYSEEMLKGIPNIDVIEGSARGAEYMLILADGNLAGAQILGNSPLPMIWSLIYKKERLVHLKDIGLPVKLSQLDPLSFSLGCRWPKPAGMA